VHLIRYRPFVNRDPPALAEIWRSYQAPRAAAQPMTAALFETTVLARPYFDNAGLIVALDEERPVGFIHVGHGMNEQGTALDKSVGVIAALVVRPEHWSGPVPAELLALGEAYLRDRGAAVVHALGYRGMNPFYMGLLGGSEARGVGDSDRELQRVLREAGYRESDRYLVLHRELGTFRPAVTRAQMQLRRGATVSLSADPPTATWREACAYCDIDRWQAQMQSREGGPLGCEATLWSLDHLSGRWGVRTAGLINLRVDPGRRRQGLATFLLGEAFKKLHEQGFSAVEGQISANDAVVLKLLRNLGFVEVEQGSSFMRELAA
jgi:ribosomal protein S18 acetylase RimI-like enzyme